MMSPSKICFLPPTRTDIKHFNSGYKESDDSEKVIMEPGLIAKQVEFSDPNVLDIMRDLVSEILVLA